MAGVFYPAKGCRVWDLDGRELIDMSIMGIGTNLLGYGHPEVDACVVENIAAGNMSTLNCPEEVACREIGRTAPLVRYGSLARAEEKPTLSRYALPELPQGEIRLLCGYHGWHDWYSATNLQNDSGLTEHLLPGLEPNGVPRGLAGSVQPFSFNRLDQLESIASNHDLAAVKMEVQRNNPPDPGFLRPFVNFARIAALFLSLMNAPLVSVKLLVGSI